MSVNLPPMDSILPRHEANFFSILAIIGSHVVIREEEQPIGNPRYLKGRETFLHRRLFAAQSSQWSVTFMPMIEILKKFTCSPEASWKRMSDFLCFGGNPNLGGKR